MKRVIAVLLVCVPLASCARSNLVIIPRSELRRIGNGLYGSNVKNRSPNVSTVRIYLVQGTRLVAVDRTGRSSLPAPQLAMHELLLGPTEAEKNRGFSTNIPDSVQVLNVDVGNNIATVDLSQDFELTTVDRPTFLLRLAQVVYTLTEINGAQAVRFEVQSQPVSVLVQNGGLVDAPVARGRYSDYAPVSSGQAVSTGPLA